MNQPFICVAFTFTGALCSQFLLHHEGDMKLPIEDSHFGFISLKFFEPFEKHGLRFGQGSSLRADFEPSRHNVSIDLVGGFLQFFFPMLSRSINVTRFTSGVNHKLTIIFVGQVPCSFLDWSQSIHLWPLLRHHSSEVIQEFVQLFICNSLEATISVSSNPAFEFHPLRGEDRIVMKMTELFHSRKMLGSRMDSSVGNLETQMREGFEKEGRHTKQENEILEKKVMMKM